MMNNTKKKKKKKITSGLDVPTVAKFLQIAKTQQKREQKVLEPQQRQMPGLIYCH